MRANWNQKRCIVMNGLKGPAGEGERWQGDWQVEHRKKEGKKQREGEGGTSEDVA